MVSTICLYIGNKTVLFRLKIRKIFLYFQKNGCSEQFKMTVFFTVNSNNQVLIHYINFLGYLFHHQSMKKKPCWFWRFLLYYFYFKIYSLNASKIYYSIKNLCFHEELFLQHYFIHILCFFNLSTTIYQKRIHIWFKFSKFFNSNTHCFSFRSNQPLICLNNQRFWLKYFFL